MKRAIQQLKMIAAAVILSACGKSEFSTAEKVINEGLAASPQCSGVPVGVPVDKTKLGDDSAIGVMKAKGLVIDGTVISQSVFGKKTESDGYVFTEKAKPLLLRPGKDLGYSVQLPCVKTGVFQVSKIQAIDYGSDISGNSIASVRATIKFVPNEWLIDTRSVPSWSKFWGNVQSQEAAQWMYHLRKSGDQFFFTGQGERLK